MQLFYAAPSPYARKCRIIIHEKGLVEKVELVAVVTADNEPRLLAVNPLGTIPALVTENGLHLCDSTVICEYLDSLPSTAPALYPADEARLCALALAVLADGIMDAAVTCVQDSRRPEDKQYAPWTDRKKAAILRAIEKIAQAKLDASLPLSIGAIATVCALDYVDFRLPQLAWRKQYPELAIWVDTVSKRPSFAATKPA